MRRFLSRTIILLCALGSLAVVSGSQEAQKEKPAAEEFEAKRAIRLEIDFAFLIHGVTQSIYFCTLIPQTDPYRQTVGVEYSIEPDNVFSDGMTRYAVWFFQAPEDSFHLTIEIDSEIRQRDLSSILSGDQYDKAGMDALEKFVVPEKWIECDDEAIAAAAAAVPDSDDTIETARAVFDLAKAKVKHGGYNAVNQGAKATFELGSGDCTDYSDLFVALMRAKKIPARVVSGWMSRWTDGNAAKHNWAEFYSDRYGWIPVDVLLADCGAADFDRLPNMFLYFTDKRNDEQNPDFCFWRIKSLGDAVTVEGECRVLAADGQVLPGPTRW